MRRWLSFTLPLLTAAACSGPSPVSVPKGEWGGRNMSLFVDDAGSFDLTGTYDPVLVTGGSWPAHYTGTLSGTMLRVTVTLDGGSVGTYELDESTPASFDVCNY